MTLELASSAFPPGGRIPEMYTCEGGNVSPPLRWAGAPPGTKSLTLICDDPDAPRGTFTHWVLYDVPPDRGDLLEDYSARKPAGGGAEGRNDFGEIRYGGPCPPPGREHRYHFRLYALDTTLDLPPGATRDQVLDRIRDHTLAQADLMGRFGRS